MLAVILILILAISDNFFVIEVKVSFKQSEYSVVESAGRVAITIQVARRYYTSFYVKIRASVNKNLRPDGMWLYVRSYLM